MSNYDDVGAFHAKFDLPRLGDGELPGLLSEDAFLFRVKFMEEELQEFRDAYAAGDLEKSFDALIDLNYVVLGTAHMMHLPYDSGWREVQRANMSKERALGAGDPRSIRSHSLDVVKPAGWTPPDLRSVLEMDQYFPKWDVRMMELAELAASWSKDPSTKVGAVVVAADDRRKIALGYNGFPPGIADTVPRLYSRDVKLGLTVHGERAVLDNCTFDTTGSTLYTTRFPCSACALAIVSKRVARVVYRTDPSYEARWAEEVARARSIFEEVGVEVFEV